MLACQIIFYFYEMKNKKAIIWDWNGTLLDDVELCINSMNSLLKDRNLQALTIDRYREIFTFPVREYYQKSGFNFENEAFELPAMQFIDLYYNNLNIAPLFPETGIVLRFFREKGFFQSVLSAMEHEKLMFSLAEKGIIHFFDKISGINDHYAYSKAKIGNQLLFEIPFPKNEIILIGDTLHDYEVAEELGVECILIANGHQSSERLNLKSKLVISHLGELLNLF